MRMISGASDKCALRQTRMRQMRIFLFRLFPRSFFFSFIFASVFFRVYISASFRLNQPRKKFKIRYSLKMRVCRNAHLSDAPEIMRICRIPRYVYFFYYCITFVIFLRIKCFGSKIYKKLLVLDCKDDMALTFLLINLFKYCVSYKI